MTYTNILNAVKKNKKYEPISDELLNDEIEKYFKKNPKSINNIDKTKSKKFKQIISEIRKNLHLISGSFKTNKKIDTSDLLLKLEKAFNDNSKQEILQLHKKILKTSISSYERLENYKSLYAQIFKFTKKPKSIIDLGCSLNPISYIFTNLNELRYYAYDINKDDISLLKKYFVLMKRYTKLNGDAEILNILKINSIKNIPYADVCFMFKVIDPIEYTKGHKSSESIIKNINCKYIVASFATKTLSGKSMNYPYRGWFERMLNRIELSFEKILFENEVFYVIKK